MHIYQKLGFVVVLVFLLFVALDCENSEKLKINKNIAIKYTRFINENPYLYIII